MSKVHPPQLHVPVLLDDVVRLLNPKKGESYLDLTAGYGGHARAILERTENYAAAVLVDRDEYAHGMLEAFRTSGAQLVHSDFLEAARQLASEGKTFDMVLLDLGVSSPQLDQAERGFSFLHDGPLDMRMDRSSEKTAADIVNRAPETELVRIITEYGEESLPAARRIAHAITSHRPITTTSELAELIAHTSRGGWKRIHPATRTFQALRIAVNDELAQLQATLPLLPSLLSHGGRLAIISFHSLEDRQVKQYLKEQFDDGLTAELSPITKKPIDGATADVHNPRARSAKLRAAVKK